MRLSSFFSIFALTLGTAQAMSNSFILTFDAENGMIPSSFMETVKSVVSDVGGKITHEYSLIKGFTIDLPQELEPILENQMNALRSKFGYKYNLEKDSEVHAYGCHDM